MMETQLGTEVRKARNLKGLSLQGLSDISGVGLRTIHAIEMGESKHPTEQTLNALAIALGISYRDLALAAYGASGNSPKGGDPTPAVVGVSEKIGRMGNYPFTVEASHD